MAEPSTKTKQDRNKLIAAIVLGILAVFALYFAFGRGMFTSSTSSAKVTPTPRPSPTPGDNKFALPSKEEQEFNDVTVPISYTPGASYAPDPGRNIFAFFEPPPPCPPSECPTPTPKPPEIKPPAPTPTPWFVAGFTQPQSVYAGSQGFRLEINGDRFTPDSRIYFNQTEMPTTFVNSQRVVTDIPASMIVAQGNAQIIVQTPDGVKNSNPISLTIMAPPRPTVQYIGLVGRKRYNNDTAYFQEANKPTPFSARLNDIVEKRFRLINISPQEVIFEDVDFKFKHRVPIVKATASASTGAPSNSYPTVNPGFGFPSAPQPRMNPEDCPPGIPCNIPRVQMGDPNQMKQQEQQKAREQKEDVDDDQ